MTPPNLNPLFETDDLNYVMPGMAKSIGELGGIRGKYFPHEGNIRCIVVENGETATYQWDVNPKTMKMMGGILYHPIIK